MRNIEAQIDDLMERVSTIEKRLNAITAPVGESNIRAAVVEALRNIADDVEDEEPESVKFSDPHEDEDEVEA